VLPSRTSAATGRRNTSRDGLAEEDQQPDSAPGLKVIARTSASRQGQTGRHPQILAILRRAPMCPLGRTACGKPRPRHRPAHRRRGWEPSLVGRYDREMADIFAIRMKSRIPFLALEVRFSGLNRYTPKLPAYCVFEGTALRGHIHANPYPEQDFYGGPSRRSSFAEAHSGLAMSAFFVYFRAHAGAGDAAGACGRTACLKSRSGVARGTRRSRHDCAMYEFNWKEAERLFRLDDSRTGSTYVRWYCAATYLLSWAGCRLRPVRPRTQR
jgi:hypothetical protein